MKNSSFEETEFYASVTGCEQCGNPYILPGYPTQLCRECRQEFLKHPIPVWIKLFGAAIFGIMIYCCISFPSNLSLGLLIERARKAEAEKNFLTAQREFTRASAQLPNDVELQCHLALAAFMNMDLSVFSMLAEKLVGKTIRNEQLYEKVDQAMMKFNAYVPNDSLLALMKGYQSIVPDLQFRQYLRNHPEDLYACFTYASILFDNNNFKPCDSLLQWVLKRDPVYFPALRLMASLKREMNDYEAADKYCEQLLNINREAGYAIASKARTRLKQKKDEEALELALLSVQTDQHDPYNTATLILAYHFNGKNDQRDLLIASSTSEGNDTTKEFYQYASDVISGKVPFRTH